MNFKIGIVGLGNMGESFSACLNKAFDLKAYDISPEVREKKGKDLNIVGSLKELHQQSDVIMLSLPGSPQVERVVEDLLKMGVSGKTIIDLSTSYPISNQKLSEKVTEAGGRFLDAPVSGNKEKAARGEVITMVGGEKGIFEELLPVFNHISSKVNYVGGPGQGNTMKIAIVYLSVMNTILSAELIPFMEKMEMDTSLYRDMAGGSGGNSKNFMNYSKRMIEHDFHRAYEVDLANKDLGYMQQLFADVGVEGILVDAGATFLKRAVKEGLGNSDISEMVRIKRNEYELED